MRATKKGEHFISLSLSLSFPFAHTLSGRCRATLRVPLLRVRLGASFLCVCACVRCALSLPHPQRRDMSTAWPQLAHFHFSSGHWRQTSLPRFRLLCLPHFLTYWPRSCTILFLSPPTLCRCGPRPRSPYEKKFSWVAAWSPLASFLFSPSSYNFLQRECALLEISLRKPALKTTPASSPGSLWGILVVLGLPSAVSRPHNAPSASTLSLRYFLSLLESNLFSSSTEQIRVFSPIQSSSPSLSLHARVCFGLTGSPPPHPHRVLVDVPSDLSRQKTASHFWSATFFFLPFLLAFQAPPPQAMAANNQVQQAKEKYVLDLVWPAPSPLSPVLLTSDIILCNQSYASSESAYHFLPVSFSTRAPTTPCVPRPLFVAGIRCFAPHNLPHPISFVVNSNFCAS